MTIYRTSRGPRALIQRLRLWRCYARAVTFADLRRIAYDAQAQGGTAEDVFAAVIAEAEAPVFGNEGQGKSANGNESRQVANVEG